ncbi:threonine ammonia-lyase [Erysipelotrichaceae bacterium MTC7]|nr:threonine ammonia-lyase [Erysipelotrichaceae bacterium MTC7]
MANNDENKSLSIDLVLGARRVLNDVIRKTDVIAATNIPSPNNLFLKTENLQLTGSFKVRGSYYKISKLSDEEKAKGIIACSAGNHAQGVALAAQKNNIPCIICMPDSAPISKVEATKSFGAEIVLVKGTYDDAYKEALRLHQEHGYTFIHPFDDVDVIAGQGTIGLEIVDQMENIDAVVVPIGGGGLISGVAYTIKTLHPEIKVYGVQAAGAACMYEACKQNSIIELDQVSTFADGIAVMRAGDTTYDLTMKYVDEILTVSDDEIAAAILMLLEKQKLLSEGAGAVAVAAEMFGKIPMQHKNVVCIVSGGNIDVNILSRVVTRGLIMSGRKTSLTIALVDKPGQLLGVSKVISDCGGNVVAIDYDAGDPNMDINSCFLKITMETKHHGHIEQIKTALRNEGFEIVKERT